MTLALQTGSFQSLDDEFLMEVEGGSWWQVAGAIVLVAGVAMALAPAIGVVATATAATTAYRLTTAVLLTSGGVMTYF